jgi:hypothetical protein
MLLTDIKEARETARIKKIKRLERWDIVWNRPPWSRPARLAIK